MLLILSIPADILSHPDVLYDPSGICNILWEINKMLLAVIYGILGFLFCICLVYKYIWVFRFLHRSGENLMMLELLHDSHLWSIVWTIIFIRQFPFNKSTASAILNSDFLGHDLHSPVFRNKRLRISWLNVRSLPSRIDYLRVLLS